LQYIMSVEQNYNERFQMFHQAQNHAMSMQFAYHINAKIWNGLQACNSLGEAIRYLQEAFQRYNELQTAANELISVLSQIKMKLAITLILKRAKMEMIPNITVDTNQLLGTIAMDVMQMGFFVMFTDPLLGGLMAIVGGLMEVIKVFEAPSKYNEARGRAEPMLEKLQRLNAMGNDYQIRNVINVMGPPIFETYHALGGKDDITKMQPNFDNIQKCFSFIESSNFGQDIESIYRDVLNDPNLRSEQDVKKFLEDKYKDTLELEGDSGQIIEQTYTALFLLKQRINQQGHQFMMKPNMNHKLFVPLNTSYTNLVTPHVEE